MSGAVEACCASDLCTHFGLFKVSRDAYRLQHKSLVHIQGLVKLRMQAADVSVFYT